MTVDILSTAIHLCNTAQCYSCEITLVAPQSQKVQTHTREQLLKQPGYVVFYAGENTKLAIFAGNTHQNSSIHIKLS